MVVTAWIMLELVGDRADATWDPILMRGDNTAAVSWTPRCGGGARDQRACLLMRMLRRLEIEGGWNHTAKHIPGVRITLLIADGMSCWLCVIWRSRSESSPTLTTGRNKTLERGVRGFSIPYYKEHSQQAQRLPVGHNERGTTRLIRVREGVCPSTNIRHALLLCPLFDSTVGGAPLTVRATSCGWKVSTTTEAVCG